MVGYKNTNSNDKVKQGWRAYVPHISNPKTEGQARQRMIVSNLTQNYTALKEIISRGFEGVKYGGKSYQRFLSLNMRNAGQGPYIPKGTRSTPLPIPGMILSQGNLVSVSVKGIMPYEGRQNHLVSDLYVPTTLNWADTNLTWGDLSQALIDGNSDIKNGDQFTFVAIAETENLEYVYRWMSLIIDTDSTEALPNGEHERTLGNIAFWATPISAGNELTFALTLDLSEQNVAGAVIQSRMGQDGAWLRSSSSMWVDEGNTDIMQYFSAEMFQLALESYMGMGGSSTTDWPTDPDPEVSQIWVKILAGADVLISDATQRVFVAALQSSDFATLKYIVRTVDGVQYLTKSDGSVYTYQGNAVPASALTGTSATRELVDINGLAEYNISNLRSAAPAEVEESDTKKKKANK